MAIAGICGVVRGEHRIRTTEAEPSSPRHPDLVKRDWDAPTEQDQLWVADFTYVWTLTGFVYVAFVVDVFSRRILGWTVSRTKTWHLVASVLRQAVSLRGGSKSHFTATGLVHHSDAGTQGGFNWLSQHPVDWEVVSGGGCDAEDGQRCAGGCAPAVACGSGVAAGDALTWAA